MQSVPVNRYPKLQTTQVNSMSAVQESPIDSPTVPIRYSVLSKTSDDSHARSSSAPGDYIRDSQTLPAAKPGWLNKQSDSMPVGVAPKGLGLSMPVSRLADRTANRQGPHKAKPSLTIQVKKEEDKPPPPPPKSPRHTRTPSIQSGVSSMHGESPSSDVVATPGSIMRAALVDAQGSPVQMPPSILHAKQGSYSSSSSDFKIREIVLTKDQNSQQKPTNTQTTTQPTEKSTLVPDNNASSRPPTSRSEQPRSVTPQPAIAPPPSLNRDQHQRERSKDRLIGTTPGSNPPRATPWADRPYHSASSSQTNVPRQPFDNNQRIQAAAKSMSDRVRELLGDQHADTKPKKPNLDKPMPNLPTNSGSLQDHIREVKEAEESEKKKRPTLKASPPSLQSSNQPTTAPARHNLPAHHPLASKKGSPSDSDVNGPRRPFSPPLDSLKESPVASQTSLATQSSVATSRKVPSEPSHNSAPPDVRKDHKGVESTETKVPSSLPSIAETTARNLRSPTPDLASRSQSPTPNLNQKPLPVSFIQPGSLTRSATPDSGAVVAKASEPVPEELDPVETLRNISKQVDALHARYTQLRSDRLKLSTAISASLKDQKPGPDYANGLLDQHLSLNAINSSMDICFAKLKALDCRKEDAIATLIARTKEPSIIEPSVIDEDRMSVSAKPAPVAALAVPEPGRSTPEIEQKTLNSILHEAMKPSPSIGSLGSGKPTPDLSKEATTVPSPEKPKTENSEAEKRMTAIRDFPEPPSNSTEKQKPPAIPKGKTDGHLPPLEPVSPISVLEDEGSTRRIRIKGAKAAKLLGLVAESGNGKAGGTDITLPDSSSLEHMVQKKQLAIEVEVQSKYVDTRQKSTRTSPASAKPGAVPKRKPLPSPRQGTNDSQGSITAGSMSESAPDEPEVATPRNSQDAAPFGLKSAKRGMLQTIQVFVDDDILDYYKNGGDR